MGAICRSAGRGIGRRCPCGAAAAHLISYLYRAAARTRTSQSANMDELQLEDVPYGNDWDSAEEVAAWAEEADRIRPWRAAIRDHIARRVATLPPGARVLELGSGPGFLAHRVLQRCPSLEGYTLLDFSEPMLAL